MRIAPLAGHLWNAFLTPGWDIVNQTHAVWEDRHHRQGKRRVRRRPSSRLLVLDPTGCLLLFRFVHKHGALAEDTFWATPGGGLEPDETFAEAAIRELKEETGIAIDSDLRGVRRQFSDLFLRSLCNWIAIR
jgi:8-oxo-dGTP pyrophosphatase MutT (NUDIX family)